MFGTAVIVLREVLEAALIIGILTATTRDVIGRTKWIGAGILVGLLGSFLLALITSDIAKLAGGFGQEIFSISALTLAVVMLAWHNIWMAQHGKALANQAKKTGQDIAEGRLACSALFTLIAIAVLREGSETVLFLYGLVNSHDANTHNMLIGGLIGLTSGVLFGYILFFGLLKIPVQWFFKITSTFITFLAAAMASEIAKLLTQADLVTVYTTPLWESIQLIDMSSVVGIFLHVLIGYEPQPSALQLIFYIGTILVIGLGMKLTKPLIIKK
ncbi:MAG: FTR1 family protein [Candidatus Methylopumilus sp.]|nr:FTR1 family protein [Candidatus Methylopumilus sp.]